MDKSKLLPSVIVSVALIVSSIIIFFGMNRLGVKIIDAGICSGNVKLQNASNRALRIIIDDDSELKLQSSQNPVN